MSVEKEPPVWGPREIWRIRKNVLVLSSAFMVLYTSKSGTSNLQSSIHSEAGLGTAALAAVFGGVLFSSLFLPVVIIKWLGSKWTVPFGFVAFTPYIIAQLKPTFYTLIPAAIIAGLGSAPTWCAMCTYLTILAEAQSKISGTSMDVLLARFLGQFFMVFHINQLWGNLISSLVISTKDNKAAVTSVNASRIPEVCGANFLPSADAGSTLQPQPPEKIQMLVGIFLALIVVAIILVSVGLDSPRRYKSASAENQKSGWSLLLATLKLSLETKQLLLVAISIFIGLQQGFVCADFTVAFVSCAIGPGTVGYVMLVYGLSDAFGCAVTGYLAKLIGRVRLVCVAVCVNIALYVLLLAWKPQAGVIYVHYVIAVIAGLCNSIWLVQVNAYYGILFAGREEPAFANFRLFESIGYIITFSISPYLRTSSKVYILFANLVIGSIGYFIVEYKEKKSTKSFDVTKELCDKGCDNKAFKM